MNVWMVANYAGIDDAQVRTFLNVSASATSIVALRT